MKFTDNPAPATLRVRRHRRRAALLSELQAIIYKRGDVSSLDALQDVVDALKASNEAEPVEVDQK